MSKWSKLKTLNKMVQKEGEEEEEEEGVSLPKFKENKHEKIYLGLV